MPRLAPRPVQLSEAERSALEQMVSRHLTPQQIAMRARIILLAEEGSNHREIARALNITRDTARYWRHRWLESAQSGKSVGERLQDAQRSGAPATFTMEQVLRLFALACAPPENYRRPISHWTSRELADEMSKQGIVERISARHVGRLPLGSRSQATRLASTGSPLPKKMWSLMRKFATFARLTSVP